MLWKLVPEDVCRRASLEVVLIHPGSSRSSALSKGLVGDEAAFLLSFA